ncbi:hypothetical protein JCM30237_26160 [Halolamina litorea]|uniref:Glycosyltransferase family 61 protein n=1 Tax=Halolamina litorea TaxID=1515593 RepID=A0ABD6BP66_9EURY|nr:glycosyltransferase family 61 protein [Halolamina litorea]
MDLSSAPRRALRKLRMDGLSELLTEGRNTLLVDVLFYRGLYHRALLNRIDTETQDDLRSHPNYVRYEESNARVKYKGGNGLGDDGERYDVSDRFVCELNNSWLLGPVGPALTARGNVVLESVGAPFLFPRRVGVGLAQSMDENGIWRTLNALSGDVTPDRRFDTAAFAVPPWANYYHWTVECLIRVRLLERHGDATGTYPTLLVPEDRSAWMDETLGMIDYAGPVAGFGGGIAAVDTLVLPTFPDPTPAECRWLRERMRAGTAADVGKSRERVYIARDDATVRRVSNQDAVERVLKRYGVETFLLGELSVREQVELFSNAELVVAPHGAGLTNILYSDDLTVIELFGKKTVATFDRIAENMDHEYQYLQCQQDGIDIRVDIDRLDQKLNSVVS